MKLFCLHISLFFCIALLGQSKQAVAIKIYLEDAETNKNVSDAKVTLEGFEIPAITGKYDKEGKFYYFTEIPAGYNTVMAYHKKYNEKGFQNTEGLPNELNLKLYTPYRVKIPGDSLNYYKEDNSKIAIIFNDTILKAKLNCTEVDKALCFVKTYMKDNYPKLKLINSINSDLGRKIFYFEKNKSKPFKRFNDPNIKKLVEDKNILILLGMLLETKIDKPEYKLKKEYFHQDGKPNYIPKYIKYVNYDTLLHRQSNQRPNYNDFSTIDKNGKKIKAKKIKILKKNYSDIYLSYKDKYKRGLLKNDIYTLNDKETDSLYKSDLKKISKGFLYDFLEYQNTDTLIDYRKEFINNISLSVSKPCPYIIISNNLKISRLYEDFKANKYGQIIYYEKNLENNYKSNKNIIEPIQKDNSEKLYKLKSNISSPFGIMDLLDYHNDKLGIKLYQNINRVNIL